MSRAKTPKEGMAVRGFFRVQIDNENGQVVGDSGWRENVVLNDGITLYIIDWLRGGTGRAVTHMAIGTGGNPASADTTLAGQLANGRRAAVSTSVIASRTAQFTAAFNSVDSFLTATANISNVGLVNTSTTNLGTFLCGAAFASSAIATNNNLNITYQIRFS